MLIRSLVAAAGLAAAAHTANAQTFVAGIPAGWDCKGFCGALGADGDVTLAPTGASRYGYIVTDNEAAENLSPFPGHGETMGSRLRSTSFAANAGDPLNFSFNYITTDGADFTDYAWARLLNAGDLSQVAVLFTARTRPDGSVVPGFDLPAPEATLTPDNVPVIAKPPNDVRVGPDWSPLAEDSGKCFDQGCGYTGWVQSSFKIAAAGNYVLEFGVVNVGDLIYQSGLAFDGITVGGVPVVPEPHTWALLAAGLGALGWVARRRRGT